MLNKLLFLLLIPFCFCCSKKNIEQKKKPRILVTIPPYAYFAKRIAQDTIDIKVLIPPGMNIHIYEPSPKWAQEAGSANIWFQIGEPFEKKIARAFQERNPQIKIINLQDGISLLSDKDAIDLSPCENSDHSHGKDLHTWLSPKIAKEQANRIAKSLIALSPEKKEFFQQNFDKLALDLEALDQDISLQLEPFKKEAILVSHSAFGYFCKDYHLYQLSIECEGKEPRPRDLEKILQQADSFKIRCVFLQQGFDNRGAILMGEKLQLPVFQVDPYAKDYIKNMYEISSLIAK